MSYRAFKRLLGETSLERKCRFLFGAFSLVLIAGSFGFYAWRTEQLAYKQLINASQLLVDPVVTQQIASSCHFGPDTDEEGMRRRAMEEFPLRWRQLPIPVPVEPKGY